MAYAEYRQRFYQIIEDKEATEIHVNVGRLGFKKDFSNKEDPLLNNILDFCKSKKYIEISNSIMDEYFFKHITETTLRVIGLLELKNQSNLFL